MHKRSFRLAVFGAIVASAILSLGLAKNTFAAVGASDAQLYKLSIMQGVVKCYEKYAKDSITVGEFNSDWRNVFDAKMFTASDSASDVWVTTHVGNTQKSLNSSKDSDMSCKQVFEGYSNTMSGFLSYYTMPGNLPGLGYTFTSNSSASNAQSGTAEAETDQIKLAIASITDRSGNNSNRINIDNTLTCNGEQKGPTAIKKQYYWKITDCSGHIKMTYGSATLWSMEVDGKSVTMTSDYPTDMALNGVSVGEQGELEMESMLKSDLGKASSRLTFAESANGSNFYDIIYRYIYGAAKIEYEEPSMTQGSSMTFVKSTSSEDDPNNMDSAYIPYFGKTNAAYTMFSHLALDSSLPNISSGSLSRGSVTNKTVQYIWNGNFKYALYYKYLQGMRDNTAYKGHITINNCGSSTKPSGWGFKNTSSTWCTISIDNNASAALNEVVSVPTADNSFMQKGTFQDVLNWLKNDNSYSGVTAFADASYDDAPVTTPTTNGDDGSKAEAECKSGSGVLGWIVCPIVKAIAGIGDWMWTNAVEDLLQVPAQKIFEDGGSVRQVWQTVNNISNIVFVILFMVVIFSQLTGVGIDNYGIKRILPRLIIVAILANLSYFICEIAVDLSNIVGAGVKGMFTGIANGVTSASGDSTGHLIGGLIADIGVGAGAFAIFSKLSLLGAAGAGATIGLAALGMVVSIVAAVIVLYLTLVIREAGLILLVVLAPIAIVLYALPNTEKISKRWLDVMKALLVVYPLCAAVVGAGALASAALGSVDTPAMQLAAMIVQVLPYFFIPMLLKKSLAGLGNIGEKLSSAGRNLGRRIGGAAQSGIRNSARFKDWEQFQRDKTAAARASKIQTRMKNKTDAGKTLSDRQKNLARKANEAVNAYTGQKMRDEIGATEDYFQAGQTHQAAAFQAEREKMFAENMKHESNRDEIHKTLKQALKEKDSAKAVAAMKELIARGGTKEALDTMEKADWQLMKDNGIEDRLVQGLGETDVDAFKAYSKYRGSGGTRGFSDWMQGKALGETVEYTDENGEKKRRAVKAASYGSHLAENGFQAMDNYSKDEAQFVQSHFDMIKSSMGENGKDLAGMVASMAAHSKDAKVKTVAEETIRAQLASGAMDIKSMGLTAEMLGSMRGATAEAMLGGLIDKKKLELEAKLRTDNPGMSEAQIKAQVEARNDDTRAAAELELRTQLGTQIKGIESDVRIRNKTAGGVLEVLGIGGNGQRTIEEVSTPVRGADAAGGTVVGGAAAAGAAGAAAQPIVVTPAGNATGLEEAYNRMGNNIAQAVREGAAAGAAQGAQQGTQQGAQQAAQNQQAQQAQGQPAPEGAGATGGAQAQGESDINEARERFVDEVMEAVHRGQAERERAQQEGNNTPPANPNNNTSGE